MDFVLGFRFGMGVLLKKNGGMVDGLVGFATI